VRVCVYLHARVHALREFPMLLASRIIDATVQQIAVQVPNVCRW